MEKYNTENYESAVDRNFNVGFSIVMPSYNHGRFIASAIDSILNQKYKNVEIIVMDGGSTDDTVKILKSYQERIRWVSEKDNGQSDAICKGFKLATKEWFTWLNSDDFQNGNALLHVKNAIEQNPDAKVIVGRGHYTDEHGNYMRDYPTVKAGPNADICREFFIKGYVAQPSVYYHRDVYFKVGGVNPDMQFTMDYDLWVRMAHTGCCFAEVSEDISGNRWYETTKTASQLLPLLSEVVRVQKREYGKVSPYYVQAISDHIFSVIHANNPENKHHLRYRIIYFKSVWFLLNCHRPMYCICGLLKANIALSGPIKADKLTFVKMCKLFKNKLF
ncbi:glycosyltransferase family 2 protein [Desulfococcaceae bacterium HSG7]|nr:glycosyltransferase family 2 protein [Desulfococcaceae bacterium HSG7]